MYDFIIVGGGIVGLLLAKVLAEKGRQVALFERSQLGQESSWAGGGIISPVYPWEYPPFLTEAICFGQVFYPALAEELRQKTGIDIECFRCGLLTLDRFEKKQLSISAKKHLSAMEYTPTRVAREFPFLATENRAGLFFPQVITVRNSNLIKALKAWLLKCPNVDLFEQTPVQSLLSKDHILLSHQYSVTGVVTTKGIFSAGHYLITAGAWTSSLLLDAQLPDTQLSNTRLSNLNTQIPKIFPIQGQMIQIQADPHLLPTVVVDAGRYLIPRKDGKILVGSTVENTGFHKILTAKAYQELQQFAYKLLPVLAQYPIVAHWCGLRPATQSSLPFVGLLPNFDNISVASGHFRLGLTLAPFAAYSLSSSLESSKPSFLSL